MATRKIVADHLEDITDPSDWDDCKIPEFKELDLMVRCQICKDFLKSPVLTNCNHIFCSICIRRTINLSNKCPVCLMEIYESGLRKLLLMDNMIKWFGTNRCKILNDLKVDEIHDSQSEKDEEEEDLKSQLLVSAMENDGNINKDGDTQGLANCPICNTFMEIDVLQGRHIDECLSDSQNIKPKRSKINGFFQGKAEPVKTESVLESARSKPSSARALPSTTVNEMNIQQQPKSVTSKQRLPNLDTSLSTTKLKERMHMLGLSTSGTRNQLEIRMKEYINLYNANLDSLNPVNEFILLNRLRQWETLISKDQSFLANNKSNTAPINYTEKEIKRQKLDDSKWVNKHKTHYNDLIKVARNNIRKIKNKNKETENCGEHVIPQQEEQQTPKEDVFSDENEDEIINL